jgi:hypothetical protein
VVVVDTNEIWRASQTCVISQHERPETRPFYPRRISGWLHFGIHYFLIDQFKYTKRTRSVKKQMSARTQLACLCLMVVCGCTSKAPPKPVEKLVPASGTVTFDGKPEAGIHVNFVPTGNNTKSHGGTAVTDASGKFQLKNFSNLDGVPVGEYTVMFSMMRMADGSVAPKDQKPIPGVTATEKLPPLWSDPSKAGPHNSVNVPEGGKLDFDFKIPAK